jgi:DNA-binding transcriptional LysR family regulator
LQKKNNYKRRFISFKFYNIKFKFYNRKFIDNILIQNQIETKQLKIIMQLNSIEGIKTAVSLGLGAAFVSSSAIEKEIELKTIEILKIENIRITTNVIDN